MNPGTRSQLAHLDRALLARIDGRRTAAEVVAPLAGDPAELRARLVSLVRRGLAVIVG